jgi:LmbE family N-acetylglucosaminyl deacetylase
LLVSFGLVLLAACGVDSTLSQGGQEPSEAALIDVLRRSERVLWIAAHADDENSSAGLIARARDLAGAFFMVSMTRGESSDTVWSGLSRGSQIGEARAKLFSRSAALLKADGFGLGPFVSGRLFLEKLGRQCPPGVPFTPWLVTNDAKEKEEERKTKENQRERIDGVREETQKG